MSAFRPLPLLALLLVGCASENVVTTPSSDSFNAVTHTLASAEVSLFKVGNTEEVAYSYRLQLEGNAEHKLVAIGQDAQCPALGDRTAAYRLVLERREMHVGLREGQGKELASDLFIASCARADVR